MRVSDLILELKHGERTAVMSDEGHDYYRPEPEGPESHAGEGDAASYPPEETSELAQARQIGAVCPRCESWQVVAGHLLDGLGQKIRFGLMYRERAPGVSDDSAPPVLALYCNACGELTFTLE